MQDDAIIGTEVEGYHIQEVLGRGGMGVVYKATDTALSRDVALKRINPSLANDEAFLRRFRSEARALARIDSPYIVSVYALRQTTIGLLIVMEYVEGGTLLDLMREGPVDWQEALPVIKQMLTALGHAHGAEVIHRDIKPRNVMLSAEGTVKVTDFGLAKVHRSNSRETVTQGVHGTLNYMSPEQVQGGADLDHRSDLYSLGMTVYEMLTGEVPFEEETNEFAKMRMIVEEELPRPDELHPQVPDRISALVMKALEKRPDDRFQSAQVMREAFVSFEEMHGEDATNAPPEAPRVPQTTGSSASGWWPKTGLAVLVLLIAAGGYWYWPYTGISSGPPETRLSVSTEPPGASVFLDGDRIGDAPLQDTTIEGRSAHLRATLAGYEPVDTTARLEGHQEVTLRLPLPRKATPLIVRSEPEGRVSLDGKDEGRTPLDRKLRTDTVRVSVNREGYYPVDTSVVLTQTQQARLDLELARRPAPDPDPPAPDPDPPAPSTGTFTLNARPSGTVSVDGERQEAGESIRVAAGETHRVLIEHPQNGACDTTLTVEGGSSQTLTCHFEHHVAVRSIPWANVYIDGENTGTPTPLDTTLAAERTYEIGGRIQSRPFTVTSGTYLRRWEESGSTVAKDFPGRTTTVTLRPNFERETHAITFQTSRPEP